LNERRSRTVRFADRKGFVNVLTLIVVTLALIPATVSAQDLVTASSPMTSDLAVAGLRDATSAETPLPPAPAATRSSRGVLIPLYASFAALQALDAHSTTSAIHRGGVEQNPMLRSIADKPAALYAVKAGLAASTIVLADRMRNRSRVGAIVLMAGLNSLYATIVVHNYAAVR